MLSALLDKLGIRSIDDLKPAEHATYRQLGTVLAKGDVSIDDLKTFLPRELALAHQ